MMTMMTRIVATVTLLLQAHLQAPARCLPAQLVVLRAALVQLALAAARW